MGQKPSTEALMRALYSFCKAPQLSCQKVWGLTIIIVIVRDGVRIGEKIHIEVIKKVVHILKKKKKNYFSIPFQTFKKNIKPWPE